MESADSYLAKEDNMAGFFDFLGDLGGQLKGAPAAFGQFTKDDPAAAQILLGNLGNLLGQGSPFLEGLGKFGAGLGYTDKLDQQSKTDRDLWKRMLGIIAGNNQGVNAIKNKGDGNVQIDMNTGLGTGGSTTKSALDVATGASGGGAAGVPPTQAEAVATPQASTNSLGTSSSDVLSALFDMYSQPRPSMKWLTPEMAIQVMGQRQNERQLANQFATTVRSQDITKYGHDVDLLKKFYGPNAKVPVRIDEVTGRPTIDPINPTGYMTTSELSSAASRSYSAEETTKQNYISNLGGDIKSILEQYGDPIKQGVDIFGASSTDNYQQLNRQALSGDTKALSDLRRINVLRERKRFVSGKINKRDLPPDILNKLEKDREVTINLPVGRGFKSKNDPKIEGQYLPPVRLVLVLNNGRVEIKKEDGNLAVY